MEEFMLKQKRKYLVVIGVLIMCFICFISFSGFKVAKADEIHSQETLAGGSEVSPQLLTTLTLTIGGENGYVWGRVRNDFTLGFSTVQVYVELYSSTVKQDSYQNMTLESSNYIGDLNIFKTIETKASTGGVTKYWMARAYFRADSGAWSEKVTSVWLFDGNANIIEK